MPYRSERVVNSLYKILSVIILVAVMSLLVNFSFQSIFLSIIKTIFVYLFIFFLPGYFFVNLLFEKELKISETLVLSIGASICLTILSGMIVHFLGIRISIANILNFLSILTIILLVSFFVKNFSSSKPKKEEGFLRWKYE